MTPMFSGHFNNAAVAAFNTVAATCAGVLVWLLVEKVRDGHPTTLGASSGAIAALHFIGGGFELLRKQAVAILAVFADTFTVTWLIAKALDLTMGIRVPAPAEAQGLDLA
jgi:ammonia channel protein AmtB